jgi:N-methylhydantoinase B
MLTLGPGDQLWEYVAGGAGYGDPFERDPELVLADVRDRKVSPEIAKTDYGVVLLPGGTAVDHKETKACRAALRRARGPIDWVFDRGSDQERVA